VRVTKQYKVVVYDGNGSKAKELFINGSNIKHIASDASEWATFNIINSKKKVVFSIPLSRLVYCQEVENRVEFKPQIINIAPRLKTEKAALGRIEFQ